MEQEGIMAKICFVAVILLVATTSVIAQATENNEQCTGESHEITFEANNEEELRKKLEDIFTPILTNNPNADLSISLDLDQNGAKYPSTTTQQDTTTCIGVTHNSTCYVVIYNNRTSYYLSGAESACKAQGWVIADIFDASHYDIIVNYIRKRILISHFFPSIFLWTGMTYKENQVVLTMGENITLPDRIWFPDYPYKNDASRSLIRIWVDVDPKSKTQGLQNWLIAYSYGVLCRVP
uniref:uncharacterized protein LOC120334972 isoform X2 n=1 Tax=Styela clava TaxID=7725 RepID=UPI00193AA364|nr:uncharacterized protein LOC120334972 isoform X2 [Styela clava]